MHYMQHVVLVWCWCWTWDLVLAVGSWSTRFPASNLFRRSEILHSISTRCVGGLNICGMYSTPNTYPLHIPYIPHALPFGSLHYVLRVLWGVEVLQQVIPSCVGTWSAIHFWTRYLATISSWCSWSIRWFGSCTHISTMHSIYPIIRLHAPRDMGYGVWDLVVWYWCLDPWYPVWGR